MISGSYPFESKNRLDSIKKLFETSVEMKSFFTEPAISLLGGLLTVNV